MKSYEELREEYLRASFSEQDAAADPFQQFENWYQDALREEVPLANACTLSTASLEGVPSSRIVLLKGYDLQGFVFFTNYDSRKGCELARNPRASLLFWWTALERQVRIDGVCKRVSADESDDYFRRRPRASNLSAMASKQSDVVASREVLDQELAVLETSWADKELERPEGWGGLRLEPDEIEFWQGRGDRFHDRLRYRRQAGPWVVERLYP